MIRSVRNVFLSLLMAMVLSLLGSASQAFAQQQTVAIPWAGVCATSISWSADIIVKLSVGGKTLDVVHSYHQQGRVYADWNGEDIQITVWNPGRIPATHPMIPGIKQGVVATWLIDFEDGYPVREYPVNVLPCEAPSTEVPPATPTETPVAPTATNTPTPTETDTPATTVPPTTTGSPVPPSATPTVTPTATQTTTEETPTATLVPPTTTGTTVPVPPTVTPTATEITTTEETPTATLVPPTTTGTTVPVPPTVTPTATMPSTTIKITPTTTNTPGPRPTQPSNPNDRTFQIFLCGPGGKVAVLDYTRNGIRRYEIVPLSADRTVGFAGISENQQFDVSLNDREGNVLTSMNVPGLLSGPNPRNEWSPSGIAAHFREIDPVRYADLIKAGEEWEPKYCSPEKTEVPPITTPANPEPVKTSPAPTATPNRMPNALPSTGGGFGPDAGSLNWLALVVIAMTLAWFIGRVYPRKVARS